MKNNKSPVLWIVIFLIVETIIAGVLFAFGFKITYAPELENNWTAIASVGTVIGSFITAMAVIVALSSNKTSANANQISRNQLEEMIYQREQSERPYIEIGFEVINSFLCFIVSNEGIQSAKDVKLRFDDDFIDMVDRDYFQDHLKQLNVSSIHIAPKQRYYIYFGIVSDGDVIKAENLKITCSYKGQHQEYDDEFHFNLNNYHWMIMPSTPLETIAKSFKNFKFSKLQSQLHKDNNVLFEKLNNMQNSVESTEKEEKAKLESDEIYNRAKELEKMMNNNEEDTQDD